MPTHDSHEPLQKIPAAYDQQNTLFCTRNGFLCVVFLYVILNTTVYFLMFYYLLCEVQISSFLKVLSHVYRHCKMKWYLSTQFYYKKLNISPNYLSSALPVFFPLLTKQMNSCLLHKPMHWKKKKKKKRHTNKKGCKQQAKYMYKSARDNSKWVKAACTPS